MKRYAIIVVAGLAWGWVWGVAGAMGQATANGAGVEAATTPSVTTVPATQPSGEASEASAATTQAVVPPEAALRAEVEQLRGEVERLRLENQALQETVDGLRTNTGPAWVSQEKFNALKLEMEHEKAQAAVLRAEIEELRRAGATTRSAEEDQ